MTEAQPTAGELIGEWQNNTMQNPYYRSANPVEVVTNIGRTYKLHCPRCAIGMFREVVKWRVIPKSQFK